jgi:NADPH:quinone reductase-like Zn-dependent oxidoreductase
MIPKMPQTVFGSLFKAPCVQPGERLLIRGETTSVRLVVATIAKKHGAPAASLMPLSTRKP